MKSTTITNNKKIIGIFERYLTLWMGLSITSGIILEKTAPGVAQKLDNT